MPCVTLWGAVELGLTSGALACLWSALVLYALLAPRSGAKRTEPNWKITDNTHLREDVCKNWRPWASLVAQWLRICLPMQGTRVRALVWEDPTCRGVIKPVSHNC